MNSNGENQRRTVTDMIIMAAIRKHGPEATTSEIADEIGLSPQLTRYRLSRLELQGELESEIREKNDLWRKI
ncbi:winged helix-turn-helix transcriptional regulator [Halalkalicoccus paucihalophilus]|uniref:winged helix-turn-helix transcriptional regulator n=1 Tax=Halalkalicoccus paucihalophilus TaxID=1008153 RepID=UPI000A02A18C